MTSRHPDLAMEQRVVHQAHDCHEREIARLEAVVAGESNAGASAAAAHKIRENAKERLAAKRATDTKRLVVGRLDFKDDNKGSIYVGPCTVMDEGRVAVVDFTRPIARGFYHASDDDPLGLIRRRTFDVLERELRDLSDEVFGVLPPRLRGAADAPAAPERSVLDRVAAELERAREPRMRDIVASIVSDQYRMIEAAAEGVFVIQGGPGTGKTAVALHRAVYLLRNHEDLGRVLVVGPNAAFMAFIADVLPGLGENRVDQVPVGRLAVTGEAEPEHQDPDEVVALKGDARLAEVVRRSVEQRIRPTDVGHTLSYSGTSVRMEADEANSILHRVRSRETPYMEGRRRFIDAMRSEMEALVQARLSRGMRRRSVDRPVLLRQLNNDRAWAALLERMWPTTSPVQAIHDLLTVEQRLRAASEGVLTDDEVSALLRRGVRTVGVHPWTQADMPLIDEAHALVQGGSATYGYVIVDEAQDLTPMELRMVARRSRLGDITLVGDMAQATGPVRHEGWDDLIRHLPADRGIRRDELRIGYRVPRSIMELANLLLPRIAPDLQATEPVREARVEPSFQATSEFELADAVALAVAELDEDDRSIGVIVPSSRLTEIRGALAAEQIVAGDISTDQLERRITLLSSADAKGLEFDRVVLVEPWDIVTSSPRGWSELYVALSRATQQLVVVHAQPLPAPLPGGVEPDTVVAETQVVETSHDVADTSDRAIVEDDELDLDLHLDLDRADEETAAPVTVAIDGVIETPVTVPSVDEADEDGAAEPEPETPATEPEPEPTPEDVATVEVPEVAAAVSLAREVTPAARRARSRPGLRLSGDLSEALILAKLAHEGHTRRGTAVPYLGHILGVASLVIEDGGTETEVVAAFLHDAIEDGTPEMGELIRHRFGDAVAAIVEGCTDPDIPGTFREVKEEHLRRLERGTSSVRRVALAEKLDNARALVRDLERFGGETWRQMDVDRDEMLWYFRALVSLFRRTFPSALVIEFGQAVERIGELAGK